MPVFKVYEVPGWKERIKAETDKLIDRRLCRDIADEMRRLCPVRTGLLRSTVKQKRNVVRVGSRKADYWAAVEYGTRPHMIYPRDKQALWWPGAEHPVKSVRHPGTPPHPFIRPAFYVKRRP